MSRYISAKLRKSVIKRAKDICEYCLINIDDTYFGGEVDHIISVKHGGESISENLALTCQSCNRNKGSDLGSIAQATGELIRFFNPRTDVWSEHFRLNGAFIEPTTEVGEVTARIFEFNGKDRILERQGLIEIGHYPSPAANEKTRL